jgi:hypothetical protein
MTNDENAVKEISRHASDRKAWKKLIDGIQTVCKKLIDGIQTWATINSLRAS